MMVFTEIGKGRFRDENKEFHLRFFWFEMPIRHQVEMPSSHLDIQIWSTKEEKPQAEDLYLEVIGK